jgi:ABC-type lipoprotein release transport system permease subunit
VRSPGLTCALLVTIAVGIGSNAVVHGFIRGLPADQLTTPAEGLGSLRVLRAAAAAVFVVACGNVAAFLLARATARTRDVAVRVALGARRRHLTSQALAETVLIATGGGVAGAVFAIWSGDVIPALFFDADAEQLVPGFRTADVLAMAMLCVVVTIACGLAPLLEINAREPARVLQRESAGPSPLARRLRAVLVIVQLGCCCVLVISAHLVRNGFQAALQTGVGQRVGDAVLATVQVRDAASRAEAAANGLAYFSETERAAHRVPGVTASAWMARPPGSRPALMTLRVEPPSVPIHDITLDVRLFTARSIDEVVMPPIAGRMFGGEDTRNGCRVVVLNDVAADLLFGRQSVGRSMEDPAGQHVEIIGVVTTAPAIAPRSAVRPVVYYYADQARPPRDREGPARFRVPREDLALTATLDANTVSADYFRALNILSIDGPGFPAGAERGHCRSAIVDQRAANDYFAGSAPGGALIDDLGRRITIVGVVESAQLRYWQRPPHPAVYVLLEQNFLPRMTLLLRTSELRADTQRAIARQVAAVPGGKDDIRVTTLSAHLSRNALAPERIASMLMGVAATLALVLGVLGAYAILAESARQQRRDAAVRLALGAPRLALLRQMVSNAMRLAAAGAAAGMIAALVVRSSLPQSSTETGMSNVRAWLDGPLVIFVLVSLASVLPMLRVLSVVPLTTLREL